METILLTNTAGEACLLIKMPVDDDTVYSAIKSVQFTTSNHLCTLHDHAGCSHLLPVEISEPIAKILAVKKEILIAYINERAELLDEHLSPLVQN